MDYRKCRFQRGRNVLLLGYAGMPTFTSICSRNSLMAGATLAGKLGMSTQVDNKSLSRQLHKIRLRTTNLSVLAAVPLASTEKT